MLNKPFYRNLRGDHLIKYNKFHTVRRAHESEAEIRLRTWQK
jgi:hypothetical protein